MPRALTLALAFLVAAILLFVFLRDEHPRARGAATAARNAAAAPSEAAQPAVAAAAPDAELSEVAARGRAAAESAPAAPAAPSEAATGSIPTAPVFLRLVDDERGRPVPHLRAELRRGEELLDQLESDAQGFARGTRPLPAGPFVLVPVGEQSPDDLLQKKRQDASAFQARGEGVHTAERDAPACEVRVPVGPTYALDVDGPPEVAVDGLRARLLAADPRRAWDTLRAAPRPGPLPWLRFSPKARFLTGGPPWSLELRSPDGLWLGVATLEDLESPVDPLHIRLEARCALHGVVLGADGAPVEREWVLAEAPGGGFDTVENRTLAVLTDAEGRFAFDAAPPGPREVRVQIKGSEPWKRAVELVAGRVQELEIRLAAGAPLRRMQVVVRSASGQWTGKVTVRASPHREAPEWVTQDAEVAGAEARVTLEGVELVKHSVQVRAQDGTWVLPGTQEVEAGLDPAPFVVRDDLALVTVGFAVRDAAGAPLDDVRLDVDVDRVPGAGDAHLWRVLRGADPSLPVPRGGRVAWMAWREGLRPAFGERVADGPLALQLALQPGWGAELAAFDADGKPLAGIALALDGEAVGSTDADGKLRVERATAPRAVGVLDPRWRLGESGDVFAESGVLRNQWPRVRLEMVARDR